MFKTFRTQILFFITIIILITAITIMYFTYRDVGRAVMDSEEASIENISHFIQLNIKNEYNQLLYSKVDSIRHLKKELKSLTSLAIAIHETPASVMLTKIERGNRKAYKETIRSMVGQWFNSPLLDQDIDWLVYDGDGQAVISSHRPLEEINIKSFLDMKGRLLDKELNVSIMSSNGEYAVFQLADDKQKGKSSWKLGYFMPLKAWDVTLCVLIDISTLVKEEEKNIQRIVKNMQQDFAALKIAESGFVFVFDGKKNMLVPPAEEVTRFLTTAQDPQSGKSHLDDFMAAAGKGEDVSYLDAHFGVVKQQFAVYTTYFRGFDWYTAIVLPVDEIQQPAHQLIARQSYIIGAIFFISLLLCFFLVARISHPLQILTEQIKRLPAHDFTTGDNEDLIKELPVSSNNEVGRLAQAFGFMITELQSNINKLMETTALKERMESELNVAREIQLGTLPTNFSFEPEHDELKIHAFLTPAREIGGDLYDFFFIDDEHLCFTLGDVADKGVPAALFMVITKVLVKICAQGNPSPADMMSRINEILGQDNPNAMFVTLVIGIYNVNSGELRYANGGHNPPIFIDSGKGPYFKKDLSGPVVGAIPGISYKEISTSLEPGQSIFLYTDGVTEAMNERDELFSDGRLLEEYSARQHKSVEEIIVGILEEVRSHAGTAPQSDDIAMMMIRRKGEDI